MFTPTSPKFDEQPEAPRFRKPRGVYTAALAISLLASVLANVVLWLVMQKQADTLRQDLKTAQTVRDDTFKKVVDLTDQVNSLANECSRLKKLSQNLVDQLTKARECLHYFKLNEGADYKAKEPPTGLQGEVTGVPRADLVEVSVGADDGLRKGHKLEVVRVGGGVVSYVGRIEVMETSPDRAVCRPDPAMLRSPIQKGDRVYANLSQVR